MPLAISENRLLTHLKYGDLRLSAARTDPTAPFRSLPFPVLMALI
jgi:hypothetical protein